IGLIRPIGPIGTFPLPRLFASARRPSVCCARPPSGRAAAAGTCIRPRAGMEHLSAIVITAFGVYMLTMGMFLISENRRPQSTLAWLLVFYLAPGLGLLIYILFGRDRKAFIKRRRLL